LRHFRANGLDPSEQGGGGHPRAHAQNTPGCVISALQQRPVKKMGYVLPSFAGSLNR